MVVDQVVDAAREKEESAARITLVKCPIQECANGSAHARLQLLWLPFPSL